MITTSINRTIVMLGCFHLIEEFGDNINLNNVLLPHFCVFSLRKRFPQQQKVQICVVDARHFGNRSRFFRYSCTPNARIRKVCYFVDKSQN